MIVDLEEALKAYPEDVDVRLARVKVWKEVIAANPKDDGLVDHSSMPSTFNALARLGGAFWRWCAKPPRAWYDPKVADILEKRETTREEIGGMNADQCARLMHTAEKDGYF